MGDDPFFWVSAHFSGVMLVSFRQGSTKSMFLLHQKTKYAKFRSFQIQDMDALYLLNPKNMSKKSLLIVKLSQSARGPGADDHAAGDPGIPECHCRGKRFTKTHFLLEDTARFRRFV